MSLRCWKAKANPNATWVPSGRGLIRQGHLGLVALMVQAQPGPLSEHVVRGNGRITSDSPGAVLQERCPMRDLTSACYLR